MSKGEPTDEKLVQDYTSKWYKKRYSGSGYLYHTSILKKMLDVNSLDTDRVYRVLDAGCGTGFVSTFFSSSENLDIVGIDISDGMLFQNPNRWIKSSVDKIPFSTDYFDIVICRSLLHHLDNLDRGLSEMRRVLKPGGMFVTWDPNHGFVYECVRKLFQRTTRFSHLHKSLNPSELCDTIKKIGFKITGVAYSGYLAYPLLGFPDILNFKVPDSISTKLIQFDEFLSRTPVRQLSWAFSIKALK